MLASITKVATVTSANTIEADAVAVTVLRASTGYYSLELIGARSESENTSPPSTTSGIVDSQCNVRSEGDVALIVIVGCGWASVTEVQIAVLQLRLAPRYLDCTCASL